MKSQENLSQENNNQEAKNSIFITVPKLLYKKKENDKTSIKIFDNM